MNKCPHYIDHVIAQVKAHPRYRETCVEFRTSLDRWNGMSDNPYAQRKHNALIRDVWNHFYNGTDDHWDIYRLKVDASTQRMTPAHDKESKT